MSFLIAIWTVQDRSHRGVLCAVESILGAARRRDARVHRGRRRASSAGSSGCCRGRGCQMSRRCIGLLAIAAGVSLIDSTRVFPGLWVMLPVGGTALLIVAGRRAWVNRAILSQPLVVWIGLISYPLYLWHWPLLSFARIVEGGVPSASLRLALLGASVGLAWATYQVDRTAGAIRIARACRRSGAGRRRCRSSAPPGCRLFVRRLHRAADQSQRRRPACRLLRADAQVRPRRRLSPRMRLHGLAERAHARRDRSVVHRSRAARGLFCSGATPLRKRCRSDCAKACGPIRRWRRWRPRHAGPRSITSISR